MATVTVNLIPRLENLNIQYQTRNRELSYGDGYEEISTDGINATRKQVRVSIIVNKAQLDAYLIQFQSLAGSTPFNWSPDGLATTDEWVCKNWEYVKLSVDTFDFIADFRQYFSP